MSLRNTAGEKSKVSTQYMEGEIFLHLIFISDCGEGSLKLTQDTSILPRKATVCCSDLMESQLREDSRENDMPLERSVN